VPMPRPAPVMNHVFLLVMALREAPHRGG